jgi:hypothetical protein
MNTKSIAIVSFSIIIGVYFLLDYQKSVPEPIIVEKVLVDLELVTPEEVQQAVNYFETIKTPNDQDLYNLAYKLVAFSFTPLTLPTDYQNKHRVSDGGGFFTGLRNLTNSTKNISDRARTRANLEAKFKPKKELARQRGVEIWKQLSLRQSKQAVLALAWFYGKTEQYQKAYFYRRIALLNGDEASDYWVKKYYLELTSEEVFGLEKQIKSMVKEDS